MKIGTIGSGMIVDRLIQAIEMTDGVELAAVYSRGEEKAKDFAQKPNAKKYYVDMDEMLADEEIDTIYVASPNSLHYPQTLKAVQAGKHVINEKPFTSTLEECDMLIRTAKENNVFLFEAITTLHLPNYRIIKENLKNIGDIRLVTCNFSQFSSRYCKYKNHEQSNAFDPAFSGGAIMDINVYNIHFTVGLFGKPNSYEYHPNIGYNGVDTSGVMIMKYDNFIATLIGAKDSSSEYLCFVQGDQASIKMSGGSTGVCKNVEIIPLKGDQIGVTNPVDSSNNIGIEQAMHMTYEVEAFRDIINNNDMDKYNALLQHTRDVMEIISTSRIKAGVHFAADKKSV